MINVGDDIYSQTMRLRVTGFNEENYVEYIVIDAPNDMFDYYKGSTHTSDWIRRDSDDLGSYNIDRRKEDRIKEILNKIDE